MSDGGIIDLYIDKAEDERTVLAKNDSENVRRVTINAAHAAMTRTNPSIIQRGRNAGQSDSTAVRRFVRSFNSSKPQVRFQKVAQVAS